MYYRYICVFIAALFLAGTIVAPCSAADPSETEQSVLSEDVQEIVAAQLQTLGLFRGVSENDFALDRAPTRVEALVMLVRLMGKEAEVGKGDNTHPFTDVPAWADAYIAYAYRNGWTNGITADRFGDGDASCAMYLTFVLRALGYSDGVNGDFLWDDPFALAAEAGIVSENVSIDAFSRRDVVTVSWLALSAQVQGTENTLAEKLTDSGAITSEAYAAAQKALSFLRIRPVYYDDAQTAFCKKIEDMPRFDETLVSSGEENPIPVPTDPTLQTK